MCPSVRLDLRQPPQCEKDGPRRALLREASPADASRYPRSGNRACGSDGASRLPRGPPDDICEFVAEAVRLTDPWYEHQKRLPGVPALEFVRSLKRAKPWWKIW